MSRMTGPLSSLRLRHCGHACLRVLAPRFSLVHRSSLLPQTDLRLRPGSHHPRRSTRSASATGAVHALTTAPRPSVAISTRRSVSCARTARIAACRAHSRCGRTPRLVAAGRMSAPASAMRSTAASTSSSSTAIPSFSAIAAQQQRVSQPLRRPPAAAPRAAPSSVCFESPQIRLERDALLRQAAAQAAHIVFDGAIDHRRGKLDRRALRDLAR